ncbi:putative Eukaryotic aspartyl protease family protein [Quillaja saponaria]|uniref:Eukaryotic aspartyl protease family protein n=1 Tax=Quillaja saponaria TaxID=32244 RepID=A0AAD7QE30_QUISA|nr:putative Eukaryotic aspartyl protease family protein [Quillaja saponaria]
MNSSPVDCIERNRISSVTRFATLGSYVQPSLVIDSVGPLLFVKFSIGNPPVPQHVVMDTGSTFLWVEDSQCDPCLNVDGSRYNHMKSTTYNKLSCQDPYCNDILSHVCNNSRSDPCSYSVHYEGGLSSTGIVGKEQLSFATSDDGTVIVPNVVFGYGLNQVGENHLIDHQFRGILGLGHRSSSLVAKLGSKFSYCIGSITDPNYEYNSLSLGDGASIQGDPTPMEIVNGLYFLSLEGIMIGTTKLGIDSSEFKRTTKFPTGVCIDAGTAPTWLTTKAYVAFTDEVTKLLDQLLTRIKDDGTSNLCYKGIIDQDLIGFPVVTFQFAGGADLVLDMESLFLQNSDVFCMQVVLSPNEGFSAIGLLAQQSYNVAYDIEANKLYVQRIDCELLSDI